MRQDFFIDLSKYLDYNEFRLNCYDEMNVYERFSLPSYQSRLIRETQSVFLPIVSRNVFEMHDLPI